MNFTSVENAFIINHINPNTYKGSIKYSNNCIYCFSANTVGLLNDGCFRQCKICRKNFTAKILTNPIANYNGSLSPSS